MSDRVQEKGNTMKTPKNNPFMLIIISMVVLLLTQTLAAFAIVFLNGGQLFAGDLSMAEADALMLELMYAHQTEILLVSYVLVLGIIWFMARRRKLTVAAFTGLEGKPKAAIYVLALCAGLAAAFWATIAVNLAPWPQAWLETYEVESGALMTSRPMLDFLAVVILGPVVEELLFRGIIYNAFCTFLPGGLAVAFQGILFGSVHSTVIWMLYAAFMGCVLGYVRKHTGSTRPCILMHMAFNGSSYLFTWFAQQYSEDPAMVAFVFLASGLALVLSIYGINFRMREQEKPKE